MSDLHWPNGSLAAGRLAVDLDQERAGWSWTSLRVLSLRPGESQQIETGTDEMLVLPLAGSCSVSCDGREFGSTAEQACSPARPTSPTSRAESPPRSPTPAQAPVRAAGRPGQPGPAVAVRSAPTDVPIELRGAGQCSRQVVNFCIESAFEADQLLACEVITPAGNWSSYPPHKHDEAPPERVGARRDLLLRVRGACGDRLSCGSTAATTGPIDVLAEVRSGDVVLVPHGWHGPAMAVPGYDMYYLNVMAGPGERRVADQRRSGPRLGQGHLGQPAGRPKAAVGSAANGDAS